MRMRGMRSERRHASLGGHCAAQVFLKAGAHRRALPRGGLIPRSRPDGLDPIWAQQSRSNRPDACERISAPARREGTTMRTGLEGKLCASAVAAERKHDDAR